MNPMYKVPTSSAMTKHIQVCYRPDSKEAINNIYEPLSTKKLSVTYTGWHVLPLKLPE